MREKMPHNVDALDNAEVELVERAAHLINLYKKANDHINVLLNSGWSDLRLKDLKQYLNKVNHYIVPIKRLLDIMRLLNPPPRNLYHYKGR